MDVIGGTKEWWGAIQFGAHIWLKNGDDEKVLKGPSIMDQW
jgi:hypothetical protein